MSSQQPEKTVIDEVVENLIKRTDLLEKELLAKNEALMIKENQTQVLLINFEKKYDSITIEAPKPDMSGVKDELHTGLGQIEDTLGKWPRPIKNEYRFTLFPEQLRSVDYVRAVLTRVILGFIGVLFLIFAYLLINKHMH